MVVPYFYKWRSGIDTPAHKYAIVISNRVLIVKLLSEVIIDEPDAHLHINLQSAMYRLLQEIAAELKAQLIIATHSEVLINATPPEKIISFMGSTPHLLGRLSSEQIFRAAHKAGG